MDIVSYCLEQQALQPPVESFKYDTCPVTGVQASIPKDAPSRPMVERRLDILKIMG